jgi:hypothetical protein
MSGGSHQKGTTYVDLDYFSQSGADESVPANDNLLALALGTASVLCVFTYVVIYSYSFFILTT